MATPLSSMPISAKPNTATVTIYNDRYAMARRNAEVIMHDLINQTQLWSVDTDF